MRASQGIVVLGWPVRVGLFVLANQSRRSLVGRAQLPSPGTNHVSESGFGPAH